MATCGDFVLPADGGHEKGDTGVVGRTGDADGKRAEGDGVEEFDKADLILI